jgi:hypothetical protein
LNKRLTDVLRLFLFKPVSRAIKKMSTARVRACGTLQSFIHLVRHAADVDASSCAANVFNNDGPAWQGPHTFGHDTRDDVC